MVTLKVQSAEDIVKAYLKTLGWSNPKELEQVTKKILEEGIATSQDVVNDIDKLLFSKSVEVFGSKGKAKEEEMVALFKYCFLSCNGSKNWKEEVFSKKPLSEKFIEAMKEVYPDVVPQSTPCKMKQQKIEHHTFISAISSLFKKSKK